MLAGIALGQGSPALLAQGGALPPERLSILTSDGPVIGADLGEALAWKALPYAAPPLGALRWRAPQPHPGWTEPRAAGELGPACPQSTDNPLRPDQNGPKGEEDCLLLNVWTPDAALPEPGEPAWPVMVWIHGGGHVQGSGSDPLYDSASLAAELGLMLVTINYRLGALGYAAHPSMLGEGPGQPAAGNYGLLDQVAALRWVQRNAAAFGGDPERLTIFGESAGGMSVCALLATPLSTGLFQGAIMQSGGCPPEQSMKALGEGLPESRDALEQGRRMARALGCEDAPDPLACMRRQPAEAVLAALPAEGGTLNPGAETTKEIVDGHAMPGGMAQRIAAGQSQPVPLIIGANADEGTIFLSPALQALTPEAYRRLVRNTYGASADEVLALYPPEDFENPGQAVAAITGDAGFVCPARRIAGWHAAAGRASWLYHFTHVTGAGERLGLGSFHGAEIAFVFGTTPFRPGADRSISRAMRGLWSGFGRDGVPGSAQGLDWPAYDRSSDLGLVLADPLGIQEGWRGDRCALWDRVSLENGGPALPALEPTPDPTRPDPPTSTPAPTRMPDDDRPSPIYLPVLSRMQP